MAGMHGVGKSLFRAGEIAEDGLLMQALTVVNVTGNVCCFEGLGYAVAVSGADGVLGVNVGVAGVDGPLDFFGDVVIGFGFDVDELHEVLKSFLGLLVVV